MFEKEPGVKREQESMAAISSSICQVCDADATSRCSACKEVFYCSVEHQRGDWKDHKTDCARRRAAQQRVTAEKARALELQQMDIGHCGIHARSDTSQYIHALNVRESSFMVLFPCLSEFSSFFLLLIRFIDSPTRLEYGWGSQDRSTTW